MNARNRWDTTGEVVDSEGSSAARVAVKKDMPPPPPPPPSDPSPTGDDGTKMSGEWDMVEPALSEAGEKALPQGPWGPPPPVPAPAPPPRLGLRLEPAPIRELGLLS